MAKTKEDEAREILAKLRFIEGQMATVQGQLSMLERGLVEIGTTKMSLDSIKTLAKDSNSLLPLGSGMFAKGVLLKQDKVLVDVGAGTIVEKELTEAEKILETREKDIRTNMTNFQQLLATFEKQYNELADRARSFSG